MSFDTYRYSQLTEEQHTQAIDDLMRYLEMRVGRLETRSSKLEIFQRHCCAYLKTQLERLKERYRSAPMEELAAICRNGFELLLIVKNFGKTEDDAHVFLLRADIDKILIHEGILEWTRLSNPGLMAHLATSKQKGVKPPPYPNVAQMAQKVGMKAEYDGFYKFYSKYIHPSAWLLCKPISELERDGYREILFMQTSTYATQAATLLGIFD